MKNKKLLIVFILFVIAIVFYIFGGTVQYQSDLYHGRTAKEWSDEATISNNQLILAQDCFSQPFTKGCDVYINEGWGQAVLGKYPVCVKNPNPSVWDIIRYYKNCMTSPQQTNQYQEAEITGKIDAMKDLGIPVPASWYQQQEYLKNLNP